MFLDLLIFADEIEELEIKEMPNNPIDEDETTENQETREIEQVNKNQNLERTMNIQKTTTIEDNTKDSWTWFNQILTENTPYIYGLFIGLFILFFAIDYIQFRKKKEEHPLRNALLESLIALIIVTAFWLIILRILMYLYK